MRRIFSNCLFTSFNARTVSSFSCIAISSLPSFACRAGPLPFLTRRVVSSQECFDTAYRNQCARPHFSTDELFRAQEITDGPRTQAQSERCLVNCVDERNYGVRGNNCRCFGFWRHKEPFLRVLSLCGKGPLVSRVCKRRQRPATKGLSTELKQLSMHILALMW